MAAKGDKATGRGLSRLRLGRRKGSTESCDTLGTATDAREPASETTDQTTDESTASSTGPDGSAEAGKRRRVRSIRLPGPLAAVVTGAVTGLFTVALELLVAGTCSALRGVSTCGGIGLLGLVVVLVLAVLCGGVLLRLLGVTDPFATSFLGVGLMAVVVLLFFLSQLASLWMLVVFPLLMMGTFLASWWVTTALVTTDYDDLHR